MRCSLSARHTSADLTLFREPIQPMAGATAKGPRSPQVGSPVAGWSALGFGEAAPPCLAIYPAIGFLARTFLCQVQDFLVCWPRGDGAQNQPFYRLETSLSGPQNPARFLHARNTQIYRRSAGRCFSSDRRRPHNVTFSK